MLRRIACSQAEVNRNRVGLELPEIEFEVLGTWQSADQREELIRSFEAEVDTKGQGQPGRGAQHVASA